MNCAELTDNLDDYIDGQLTDTDTGKLAQHIAGCATCTALVQSEQQLRDTLAEYADVTVPTRDAVFFDQALARAAITGAKHQGRVSWFRGFASAAAAAVVLWTIASLLGNSPPDTNTAVPAVTMSLEQPQTVNLVFSSASDLEEATLSLMLPPGIEIAGFTGQREVTWVTRLSQGKNILPLTLVATSAEGGVVLATLQHNDDDRSFRLVVSVT